MLFVASGSQHPEAAMAPLSNLHRSPPRILVLALAALTLGAVSSLSPTRPAAAAPSCSALTARLYDRINLRSGPQFLSRDRTASDAARNRGFTWLRGDPVRAAVRGGSSLAGVHRLYRPSDGNYFYSVSKTEIARAVSTYRYDDQGVVFYAATRSASCLVPTYSYYRAGKHRFSAYSAEGAALVKAGWRRERVRFYVGRPAPDPRFTIAVLPDTQQEVLRSTDTRFSQRTRWLLSSQAALDLRFVTHVGDVVNWDTPDHIQYQRARSALGVLGGGDMPYSLTVGNHDTAAVGVGGGAADPPSTYLRVRDTSTFNRYLNGGADNLAGRFESGKVDNSYSLLNAGGLQWLVMNLELWPRPAVVSWARRVAAAHPRHNLIVVTHSYLNSNGTISTSNGGYGATSPRYLYDNLIKVYPNVRMVFSGHTGRSASRQDRGVHGNTIYSFLLCMHDNVTNPTRVVELDTSANTLKTSVYAPYTRQTYPSYTQRFSSVRWMR